MLSPSVPPGRSSISNETFGCSAVNASVTPCTSNVLVSVLSTSTDSVTSSPPANSPRALPAGAVVSVDRGRWRGHREQRQPTDECSRCPESGSHALPPCEPDDMPGPNVRRCESFQFRTVPLSHTAVNRRTVSVPGRGPTRVAGSSQAAGERLRLRRRPGSPSPADPRRRPRPQRPRPLQPGQVRGRAGPRAGPHATARAAKRFGIVPVGFITGEFESERRRSRRGEPRHLPSGFVTMLLTDVEGSTALLHRLGDGYGTLLDGVRTILERRRDRSRRARCRDPRRRVLRRVQASVGRARGIRGDAADAARATLGRRRRGPRARRDPQRLPEAAQHRTTSAWRCTRRPVSAAPPTADRSSSPATARTAVRGSIPEACASAISASSASAACPRRSPSTSSPPRD